MVLSSCTTTEAASLSTSTKRISTNKYKDVVVANILSTLCIVQTYDGYTKYKQVSSLSKWCQFYVLDYSRFRSGDSLCKLNDKNVGLVIEFPAIQGFLVSVHNLWSGVSIMVQFYSWISVFQCLYIIKRQLTNQLDDDDALNLKYLTSFVLVSGC